MELGKAIRHEINIRASANQGFIVKIGCGEFVFHEREALIAALDEYLKDPEVWEVNYNRKCAQEITETDEPPPLGP